MKGVPRVALVVPALATAGGVPAVAKFLYQAMVRSNRYEPHFISVPMSSRDASSARILAPGSWFRGPSIEEGVWNNCPYKHVGALAVELEFQRYRPRRVLTEILARYDLVQVVAGAPAWAYLTRDLRQPVLLQVATLSSVERQSLLRTSSWAYRIYLSLMNKIVNRIEEKALDHVSVVFVENTWMYECLSKKMGASRVFFSPPGVDTKRFCPGHYQADSYILSVGRLNDPRKNVRLLIEAYYQLRQMIPAAPRLVLAGKSMPDASVWQWVESLGIADYIVAQRDLSVDDLASLYREASLFVLSSDEEGLGIVILEAMASGLPVVSTDCGGPATAVIQGETGLLTPVGDAVALANAMRTLLENPALAKQMGRAGRERAENHFSIELAGRVFLDTYDLLLTGR